MRRAIVLATCFLLAPLAFASAASAQEQPASQPPPPPPPGSSPVEPVHTDPPAPEVPVQPPPVAPPPPAPRVCRSRAQCDPMRCLHNVCVDAATFAAQRAPVVSTPAPDGSTRVYLGGVFGAPLPVLWDSQVGVGVQAAARLGVIISHAELALEVSPATTLLWGVGEHEIGMFEAAGTVGYLVPISPYSSWVLRAGGGGGFAFPGVKSTDSHGVRQAPSTTAFGEVRFDLIGVQIRTSEHLLVELDAPSYRILLPVGGVGHVEMMFVTTLGFSYVF